MMKLEAGRKEVREKERERHQEDIGPEEKKDNKFAKLQICKEIERESTTNEQVRKEMEKSFFDEFCVNKAA